MGRRSQPWAHRPRTPFNVRQFLSYVWQFYLPRLSFMSRSARPLSCRSIDIWIRQGLGNFGWLDVFEPDWVYTVGTVIAAGIAVAAAVIVGRPGFVRRLPLLSFFALALLALLILLHVSEYRVLLAGGGQFNQGRYLLPVVGLASLAVATVVRAVPQRARAAACGLTLTALLVLQVISLTAVAKAYYL